MKRLRAIYVGWAAALSVSGLSAWYLTAEASATPSVTNNPISESDLSYFHNALGLDLIAQGPTTTNVSNSGNVSSTVMASLFAQNSPDRQQAALNATNSLVQQFGGTSRNIQFVVSSRKVGDKRQEFVHLSSAIASTDPNIKSNLFENVPCYLVTISGVNIASSTPNGLPDHPTAIAPATQLQVLVDAINDQPLLIFCHHPVA